MTQNATQSALDPRRRQVAELLALGELSDEEIGERVGVSRATINRWKKRPEIRAFIAAASEAIGEAIRADGITKKQTRLDAYEAQHAQFEQIRRERAEDAAKPESKLYGIPGATTGWIIGALKLVTHKNERDGSIWKEESWEYTVDTGLSREMNNLRKQVAQEVGDWTEKQEIDQTGVIEFVGIDPDKL